MGTSVGDEVRAEELGACRREGDGVQTQGATDAGVGVVTQASGIGDGEEEEVQGQGVGSAAGGDPGAEEALVAPAEARRDLAEAFGSEEDFLIIHDGGGNRPAPCRRISAPLDATRWR